MGTPNLIGTYDLDMSLVVRASSPPNLSGQTMAATDCCLPARLQLVGVGNGNGTLSQVSSPGFLSGSRLFPWGGINPGLQACVVYAISGPGGTGNPQVVDNGDGTYTVLYNMSVTLPSGTQSADTHIRLEITELQDCNGDPNKLSIVTVESFWRGNPGTPLASSTFPPPTSSEFFNHATPDWRGCRTS